MSKIIWNACLANGFLPQPLLLLVRATSLLVEASRGGKIGRERLEGTYTLDADCTGTLALATVGYGKTGFETHWDLYVTEDHKRGHLVRMDDGNMAVRSFEK
jgi:hypothetical protein